MANDKLNDPVYAARFSKLGTATREFNRVDKRLNNDKPPRKQ